MRTLLLLTLASAVWGQELEESWTVGGSSANRWPEWSRLDILVDDQSARGSLQPLELRPDENILPHIYALYPFERRAGTPDPLWIEGMPRLWRGFGSLGQRCCGDMKATQLYVDGDVNSFHSVTRLLNHKAYAEFYTIDVGGALPLERFMIQLPPTGTDKFGEPWTHYAPQNGELTGSWLGEQIPAEIENGKKPDVTNEFGELRREEGYEPLDVTLGNIDENFTAPIDLHFSPQYLRYVRWRSWPERDSSGGAFQGYVSFRKLGYAEFELYGRGFAHNSRFEAKVADLKQPAIVGSIQFGVSKWRRVGAGWEETLDASGEVIDRRWQAGRLVRTPDAEAEAWVRIRTGSTGDPRAFFTYTDFGELTTTDFETWKELDVRELRIHPRSVGWQGPVITDLEAWTPWSAPVRTSDTRVPLKSGNYLQLMAEFRSYRPTDVARLDSVRIELVPVLVPTLVGEVGLPGQVTTLPKLPLGEPTALVYALRAEFDGYGQGFDAVHITTPSTPDFLSLRIGDPLREVVPDEVEADSTGLTVFLPSSVRQDETIWIDLRTSIYTVSENLAGAVFGRDDAQLRQLIDGGNADDAMLSDQLNVVADNDISVAIDDLEIQPRSFTPNGDGRNDLVRISYTLFGVRETDVVVTIYNLRGETVHRFVIGGQSAGVSAPALWDGRDHSGRLLPPGLYLCQVETETSRGRFAETVPIAVAY